MTTHIKIALLALTLGACVDAPATSTTQSQLDDRSVLFPPDSHPYGRSIEEWAENWSDIHQGGPVYFLPATTPGGGTSFTIPRNTAIAVILSSVLNDYPCPDPNFQPAPGQTLLDFLLGGAVGADNVASITGTLDGVALDDLADFHFTSNSLMTFTGDPSLVVLDNCITGSPEVAAIEAHFIVVKPLDPGTHALTTHLTTTAGITHDRTSTITVP